jgi:hypothetical protein
MAPETVALLGRFIIVLVALLAGLGAIYWGVGLYRMGLARKGGNVRAAWGDKEFVLSNGAPGSFLAIAGVAVIVVAILKLPNYERSTTIQSTKGVTPSGGVPAAAMRDTTINIRVSSWGFPDSVPRQSSPAPIFAYPRQLPPQPVQHGSGN